MQFPYPGRIPNLRGKNRKEKDLEESVGCQLSCRDDEEQKTVAQKQISARRNSLSGWHRHTESSAYRDVLASAEKSPTCA